MVRGGTCREVVTVSANELDLGGEVSVPMASPITNPGMRLPTKVLLTFLLATFAAFFFGLAVFTGNGPDGLGSLYLAFLTLAVAGTGIIWLYRASRSSGVFILLTGLAALLFVAATTFGWSGWASAPVALVSGLLLALQPKIEPWLSARFKEVDDSWHIRAQLGTARRRAVREQTAVGRAMQRAVSADAKAKQLQERATITREKVDQAQECADLARDDLRTFFSRAMGSST